MATLLHLYDGTSTLDLNNGSTYRLAEDWVPQIAEPRLDELSGRGPVEDAIEDIPVLITGATLGALQTNIRTLQTWLHRATRAYAYQQGAIVRLRYLPDGSSLGSTAGAAVQAPIYGAPTPGEPTLTHTRPAPAAGVGYLAEARVHIRRGGLWVAAADSPVSSSAVQNPNVFTCTLASHDTPSPCAWSLAASGGNGWAASIGVPAGRLILTDSADKITVIESTSSATFTSESSSATTAKRPRGGSVQRVLLGTPIQMTLSVPSTFGVLARRTRVFLAAHNQSTAAWDAYCEGSTGAATARTRPASIATGSPDIFDLGTFELPDDLSSTPLREVTVTFLNYGSGTFDVDYLVLVAVDEATTILALDSGQTYAPSTVANSLKRFGDPSYLTRPAPLVGLERTTPSTMLAGLGYRGDPVHYNAGTTVAGIYLARGHTNDSAFYREVDYTNTSVLSHALTITRSKGYVAVP